MKTEAVCLEVVRNNGDALQYVPEAMKTEAVCLETVRQNDDALQYVPEAMRTEPVCLEVLRRDVDAPECTPGACCSKRVLRLATDFSGIETPSMAFEELGVRASLVAACEAQSHLRDFIVENFRPDSISSDVFERQPTQCEVYAAGPPCVRFSHLGLRRGEPVASESTLERSLEFIAQTHPKVFLLENVVGLCTLDGGKVLTAMLERLQEGGV